MTTTLAPTTGPAPRGGPHLLSARWIVLVYGVVSVVWIALSDRIVALLFPASGALTLVSTLKGWGFVVVTGGLLAVMLHRHDVLQASQTAQLATRERRFRLLAEHAQDIIWRVVLEPTPRLDYVSPAIERVLGYPPSAFSADPGLFRRLVHPEERWQLDSATGALRHERTVLLRMRHADGRWVWIEQRGSLVLDEAGQAVAVEGVARDVTEQRTVHATLERVNRIQRTLSAANQALVRADQELPLLGAICQAAVAQGGYRFAWVGYREDDAAGTVRPVAQAGQEDDYLRDITVSWHDVPSGRGPTGTAVREDRPVVVRDTASDPVMAPWRDAALHRGYASSAAFPLRGHAGVRGALSIYAAEPDAFGPAEVALLDELAADLSYGIETLRTRAAAADAEAARRRLATAIEQSVESVVITDADGRITYVNPAFERSSGYAAAEALGQNPRLLASGRQTRAFYVAMWQALTEGRPWAGDLVNRRKDGSLYTEAAVISPVRDPAGTTTSYVAVQHDVTAEREAEAREQACARERSQIAQALAALPPQATPEETADAVCQQIVGLPEAAAAVLLAFDGAGGATPLGTAESDGPALALSRLGDTRARQLRQRASEGPWVAGWRGGRGRPFSRAFAALGIGALAYAPIWIEQDVVGLLEVGSVGPDAAERLTERLPALVEFASIAGAALGPAISGRSLLSRSREQIAAIIDQRAYHPVFQPIVDLGSLAVIGYEALTRFEDGTPPDAQFLQAAAVGLGLELEMATLGAALMSARALPAVPWLNVNVSPALVLAGAPLRSLMASYAGQLVLEVTEHEVISDYVAFRDAVAALGPGVQIAVDDAGAGFASLRHIVELRPQIVKIDRSLVAGLNADPARQALLAGLRHFTDSQGCRLVAEGIETEAELAALVALGVRSGQGYLLGRPVPVLAEAACGRGSLSTAGAPARMATRREAAVAGRLPASDATHGEGRGTSGRSRAAASLRHAERASPRS
ncbi:MAG: EAL domain-containing protein [Candidatus Limnocylindrales bacterium]